MIDEPNERRADQGGGEASGEAAVKQLSSTRGARFAIGLALLAGLSLVGALAFGLRAPGGRVEAGHEAPTFTLQSYGGDEIPLASLRGRVIVLNFWASWCIECDLEAADLEDVWRDYSGKGVTVLGVAYTDTEPAARAYIDRHGMTYPNGPDRGARISRAYGLTGVPETVIIDRDGLIVPLDDAAPPLSKVVGPILPGAPFTPRDLRATLDEVLAAGGDG